MTEDNRTVDQKYRSAVAGLYGRLKSNYDSICEKFGDDGLELVAEMSRAYGDQIAARARSALTDNDIRTVGEYLIRIFNTMGDGSIVTENTGERVVIRVDRCPLNFTRTDMCLAHTEMETAVVRGLNPALTYRIGRSIPAGDSYCEHILERDGGGRVNK